VVVVVLDDTGFAQLGCFGSDIETPNIDALAAGGLRYNRFHVTALCSPTRACLLTGQNHHAVGMGFLADIPIGFPGYTGRIPPSAATLARVLRDAGWATFAVGKWHLAPRWDLTGAGPYTHWPLGLGFEKYYGFLAGDTNQWAPELVCGNELVDAPRAPEDGYHLTEDLADRAIGYVRDLRHAAPDKPFFLYFATGAMHAPHQAPRRWLDHYRGRFDGGWETWRSATIERQRNLGVVPPGAPIPERPEWIPAWDELGEAERRLYARQMECFAAFLSHTDEQIGRVIDALRAEGVLDDTLVFVLSDNGASGEGGPIGSLNEHRFAHDQLDDLADSLQHLDDFGGQRAYNHYAWGWAWAGNAPLRLWKRYSWLGGVRTPLIVHWPAGIAARGAVRECFAHVVDLMPTVLDVCGVGRPETVDGHAQRPIDGATLRASFDDPDLHGRSTQYFEMLGSRAIYHDGWKATTDHVSAAMSVEAERIAGSRDFDTDRWELFDLAHDFAEAVDRSSEQPHRVRDLVDRWWSEAGRNQVLPLDDTFLNRAFAMVPAPQPVRARAVFRSGGGPVHEDALPPMGAGFTLRASVDLEHDASGVVVALGDWNNGWALWLRAGVPVFSVSLLGDPHRIEAAAVAAGLHEIEVSMDRDGEIVLAVDGAPSGSVRLRGAWPFRWQIGGAGMRLGHDRGLPVDEDYRPPFALAGAIDQIAIESHALAAFLGEVPATAEIAARLHRE
jgi:arylsulfatase